MKKKMKKIMLSVAAAALAFFAGCKDIPTVDTITTTATAVGVATGTALNLTKIPDGNRNAIVQIVKEVQEVTPETNQTFEAAWMPVAKKRLDALVAEGKLKQEEAALAEGTFKVVCNGVDYLFEYRFKKANQYKDLVAAAGKGFTGGFLSVFQPAGVTAKSAPAAEPDKEALEYIKGKLGVK